MPNVSPKPYKQAQQEFQAECVRLAELAFSKACNNNYEQLYLCGSKEIGLDSLNPRTQIWRRLTVATAAEMEHYPELSVVRTEPLPAFHLTLGHLTDVVRDWLKSEPLYIFAD